MITHLSFTRCKELLHSPLALKRYIESGKKETTAMLEGRLIDTLLYEPDMYNFRFKVMPEGFKKPTSTQLKAKNPSPETIAQIEEYDLYVSAGLELITAAQDSDARYLADAVRNNSTVRFHELLNPELFTFQKRIEFFYSGFKHIGVIDADGIGVKWDLKRMGNTSGEGLVRNQIRSMKYDLQAAIYCYGEDESGRDCKYYIIAVDNNGYVTPFEISRDARMQARFEWNKAIGAAHRLKMTEQYDMGCEFWADRNGFFQY